MDNIPISALKKYRRQIFPSNVIDPSSDPHFSLESPDTWVREEALTFFKAFSFDFESSEDLDASGAQLVQFRNFVLPEPTCSHPYFNVNNSEIWVSVPAFQKYHEHYLSHHGTPAPSILSQHSNPAPLISRILSPPTDLLTTPTLPVDVAPSTDSPLPSCSPTSLKSAAPGPVDFGAPASEVLTYTRITTKESGYTIHKVTDIPPEFEIPDDGTKVAYLVDLSSKDLAGETMIGAIRGTVYDSFGGGSTGNPTAGDTYVPDIFGGKVRCQRAQLYCAGIKTCKHIDPTVLQDFKRGERDESIAIELHKKVLSSNEEEARVDKGLTLRFFDRVKDRSCPVADCTGKAMLLIRAKRSSIGKSSMIGCSVTCPDGSSYSPHLSLDVEDNVDEETLKALFSTGALNGPVKNTNIPCYMTLRTSSHKEICPFTHLLHGELVAAPIISHECPSTLIILVPIAPTPETAQMAIVIPKIAHNHYSWTSAAKVTASDKEFVRTAMKAMGKSRITPHELRTSATTRALFANGGSWAGEVPALANAQRLRRLLSDEQGVNYPHGKGWEGVQHEFEKNHAKDKRYIHNVVTEGDIKVAVTMHSGIAMHIQSALFIGADFTFKWVKGKEFNEWKVATMLNRYSKRVILATVYTNKHTHEAYRLIFKLFFETVEAVTGRPLRFHQLDPINGTLRGILLDGEPAQFQGLGLYLMEVVQNHPSKRYLDISDPGQLALHFGRTCKVHFQRNIVDTLGKHVTPEEKKQLLTIFGVRDELELAAYAESCKKSGNKHIIDWWKQKEMYPWYIHSVNEYLSPMSKECWEFLPKDTNTVESSHVALNAAASINRPLLDAITDANDSDEQVFKELKDAEETPAALVKPWNNQASRENKNTNRRHNNAAKTIRSNEDHREWERRSDEVALLRQQIKDTEAALAPNTMRQAEIVQLKKTLHPSDAKYKALAVEKKELIASKKAELQEIANRRLEVKALEGTPRYIELRKSFKSKPRQTDRLSLPENNPHQTPPIGNPGAHAGSDTSTDNFIPDAHTHPVGDPGPCTHELKDSNDPTNNSSDLSDNLFLVNPLMGNGFPSHATGDAAATGSSKEHLLPPLSPSATNAMFTAITPPSLARSTDLYKGLLLPPLSPGSPPHVPLANFLGHEIVEDPPESDSSNSNFTFRLGTQHDYHDTQPLPRNAQDDLWAQMAMMDDFPNQDSLRLAALDRPSSLFPFSPRNAQSAGGFVEPTLHPEPTAKTLQSPLSDTDGTFKSTNSESGRMDKPLAFSPNIQKDDDNNSLLDKAPSPPATPIAKKANTKRAREEDQDIDAPQEEPTRLKKPRLRDVPEAQFVLTPGRRRTRVKTARARGDGP